MKNTLVKRMLALVVSIVMLLSVAGCSKDTPATNSGNDTVTEAAKATDTPAPTSDAKTTEAPTTEPTPEPEPEPE